MASSRASCICLAMARHHLTLAMTRIVHTNIIYIKELITKMQMQMQIQIIWRDSDSSPAYESARLRGVFNKRRPPKFPLAIIKATSTEDVVSAIQLAITHNSRIAVRAGGHSFPVWSLQDDSILIDLGEWRECTVDRAQRTAAVTPGVTSQEINDVSGTQGLMFPAGHCGDVGLGGFLLQGGMGWNCGVGLPYLSVR